MAFVLPFTGPLFGVTGTGTFQMDATTDWLAFEYVPSVATAIAKVTIYLAKVNTPGTMGVVIAADISSGDAPAIDAGPPQIPTDIGGGSPTLVTATAASISTGNNTFTFTNAYTPTIGTRYWIVFYPVSGTWDASNRYLFQRGTSNFGGGIGEQTLTSTDTGSTWTRNSDATVFFSLQDASDNYLPTISAAAISATGTSVAYNNGNTPDEYALVMTLPTNVTLKLHGIEYGYRISNATTSDHDLVAITDPYGTPFVLETISVDVSQWFPVTGTTRSWYRRFLNGPYTLTGGTVLACSVKATSTGDVTLPMLTFVAQAAREASLLMADIHGASRNNGSGVFTAQQTIIYGVAPRFEVVGTAGGGGGLARIIGG